jgi:hypothetical protein
MFALQLIGDYRYSGAIVGDRMFSIVRNGDELLRVSEVFNNKNAELLWEVPLPMTLKVLDVLKHEQPPLR